MIINIHKSASRGKANLGWLQSRHTYSFSNYYDPERMGFGKLRVINDDIVAPSMGFGTHPHKNMEIISIPLSGSLRHQDSMGNEFTIEAGEVQLMSAGIGVTHSEYNNSDESSVNFLQIWVLPKQMCIKPRYAQNRFDLTQRHNQFQLMISPDGEAGTLEINQDAYFSMANLDQGQTLRYSLHHPQNGVYVFVIAGSTALGEHLLETRDGAEVSQCEFLDFVAKSDAQILCIETPL